MESTSSQAAPAPSQRSVLHVAGDPTRTEAHWVPQPQEVERRLLGPRSVPTQDQTLQVKAFSDLYFTRDANEDHTIYDSIVKRVKPRELSHFNKQYDFWISKLRDIFRDSRGVSTWVECAFFEHLLLQVSLQGRSNMMVKFFSDQFVAFVLSDSEIGAEFITSFALWSFNAFEYDNAVDSSMRYIAELISAGFEIRGLAGNIIPLFCKQSRAWLDLPKFISIQIVNPVCDVVYNGRDLYYGIKKAHKDWFAVKIEHQARFPWLSNESDHISESSESSEDSVRPKLKGTARIGSDFTRGSIEAIIEYVAPGILGTIGDMSSKIDKVSNVVDKVGDFFQNPLTLSALVFCELLESILAVYRIKIPILSSTRTVRTVMLTVCGFAQVNKLQEQAGDITWAKVCLRLSGIFSGLGSTITEGIYDIAYKAFEVYTGVEDYTDPTFWYNLLGKIPGVIKSILDFITDKLPAVAACLPDFMYSDKVAKYCNIAHDLFKNNDVMTMELYVRMLSVYGIITKLIGSNSTRTADRAALSYWHRKLENRLEANKAFGVLNNCSRHKPPAIVFMGGAGEGKGFSQARLVEFLTHYLVGEIDLKNGANPYVFNFLAGNKFFDGYNPDANKITVIDDFLQKRDSVGADNSEPVMFSRMANEAPFVPPMANLDSKGVLFKTDIIIASTNLKSFSYSTLPSVQDPKAITRRIDFFVKVIPNEAHKDYIGSKDGKVKDVSKLFKSSAEIDLDRLRYRVWEEQVNGEFPIETAKVVDFHGLLNLIIERYEHNVQKANTISSMVAQMLDAQGFDKEVDELDEELASFDEGYFSRYSSKAKNMFDNLSFEDFFEKVKTNFVSQVDKATAMLCRAFAYINEILTQPVVQLAVGASILYAMTAQIRTPIKMIHHFTDADVEMVEPISDITQQARTQVVRDISAKITKSNTYAVFSNGVRLGWGVFVMEDILLMPYHFLVRMFDKQVNSFQIKHCLSRDKVLIVHLERLSYKRIGKQDLVLAKINGARSHADITRYMQPSLTSSDKQRDICLSICEDNGALSHIITTGKLFKPGELHAAGSDLVHQPVVYNCKTTSGDCGSLVFIDETHTSAQFLLSGMHTAGTGALGVGEQVSRETILENLPYKPRSVMDIRRLDVEPLEEQSNGEPYLFKVAKPVFLPDKSAFTKTNFDEFLPEFDIHKPAILRPCVVKGEVFKPTQKYIDTLARTEFNDDVETIDLVCTMVIKNLFKYSKAHLPFDSLTFEQAVTGEGTDGFIGSLNRSTSAGYPECFQASKAGLKGKQHLFGIDGPFDFSSGHCERLRCEVEDMLKGYRDGERRLTYGMYFPKDELLKAEKRERTTRAIVGISVSLVIVQRMIWGRVFEDVVRNRITNGVCIGINPFSSDWDHLYSSLVGFSEFLGDGDFKDYSATQDKAIVERLLEALAKHCFTDELYDLACASIPDIVSGYVVVRGKVVQISSPGDGSFLTTVLNCLMVTTILCLCWVDEFGIDKIEDFFKNVKAPSYGDDHLTAVKRPFAESFSGDVIRRRAKERGFKYTPGDKGEHFSYKNFKELEFLKRLPRYEPLLGHIVGALQLTSIFKSLYWDRKTDDDYREGKFKTVLIELALHEPEVWDKYIEPVKAYMHSHLPSFPILKRSHYIGLTRSYPTMRMYNPELAGVENQLQWQSVSLPVLDTLNIQSTFRGVIQWQAGFLPVRDALNTQDTLYNREIDMATTTGKLEEIPLSREQDPNVTRNATTVNSTSGAVEMAQDRMIESLASNFRNTGRVARDIEDLKSFFSRPIKIADGTISVADIPLTIVGGPIKLFANYITLPIIRNKLQGYLGFRGCVKLRLKLNATRFQQGLLRLVYYPGDADQARSKFGMRLTNLVPFSQLPGITIDINKDTEVEFCIPYVRPELYYNLINGDGEIATVYLGVYSPLVTGATEVAAFDWTLYMSVEDIEFAMPALSLQAGEQQAMNQKPISSAIMDVSSAATKLGTIPILSSVAKPVAWFTASLSKAISAFGFSKPILDSHLQVVQGKTAVFNPNSDGVDGSISLGLSALNTIGVLPEAFGRDEDEMSVEFIAKRFSYHSTVAFADQAAGTVLKSITWQPTNMTAPFGDAGCSVKWNLPFEFLANMFEYYTGDLVLRIHAAKTEFHSGRLLVSFTPQTTVAPTIVTSDFLLKTIVDFRDDSIFEVKVPFPSLLPYLKTNDVAGAVHIIVLNELRAPASVSQSINLVLELAMENVEFACPDSSLRGCLPYTTGAFVAQARLDLAPGAHKTLASDAPLHCQGEVVRSLNSVTKAHYVTGMLDLTPPEENYPLIQPLGAGSAITGPINCFNLGAFSSIMSSLGQGPVLSPTPIDAIAWMFAFHRGSYRVKVQPATTNFPVSSYVQRTQTAFTDQVSNNAVFDGVISYAQRITLGETYNNLMEMRVPHYHQTFLKRNVYVNIAQPTAPTTEEDCNQQILVVRHADNVSALPNYFLLRSVGDDFQFGFFLSAPCTFVSKP